MSADISRTPSQEKMSGEKDTRASALPVAQFEDPNTADDVGDLEDDSPYPEVRSAVANTDDVDMPCSTIRAWVIGLFWAIIIPGLNQFFFFRWPNITITGLVAQLVAFPMGRAWAKFMPRVKIFGVSLNPGPFTVKEHVLLTVMATVTNGSAYATDVVAVQRVYYNQHPTFAYQWLIVMSTQLIGFSIGGIMRRFLVSPPSMIWPSNLVLCALFNTLHSQEYAGVGNRGGVSRERFFVYAFVATFFWYFLPGYLFTALSWFSWVTWIAPTNVPVNQMFGYSNGLGMSVITFDWTQITATGSPLATPWWAEANVAFGFVLFYWILAPALHFSNVWYGKFMPISTRTAYDNRGLEYDVTKILDENNRFNEAAYKAYSPLFLSTVFAIAYGTSFASITATLMHAFLYFRKQIWNQARRSLKEQPDIHARLMARYPEVPEWWYMIIFITMFVFGAVAIEVYHTDMPMWAFVLALVIAFFYIIPIGMIQAITNQQVGLNVITELIVGYALPGKPLSMMIFKTYGYISMAQGSSPMPLQFASDMKLGHYMKVRPRAMFWAQTIASIVAATTQLGVQSWMFSNIEGICTPHQKNLFICASTQVFGTASIIWGVIGPARQFSSGQVYYGLVFFFLIGALLPLGTWAIQRKWPHGPFKYINWPVIFAGTGLIPPASALNYVPWAIVGFIFQYVIRRRHFAWWTKYNYVLSAALDSGTAISTIFIFFTLQYPKAGTIGSTNVAVWWGNTVYENTADYNGTSLNVLPVNGTFGPGTW